MGVVLPRPSNIDHAIANSSYVYRVKAKIILKKYQTVSP